jgi:hypothetical protein
MAVLYKDCSFHPDPLSNMATFIKDFPRMLPTKFRFIWQSGFRGDFLEINQSETRFADLKKSSSETTQGQMNRNLVGRIYGSPL